MIKKELMESYNILFNDIWRGSTGFQQLQLRDLNNIIVKIIQELKIAGAEE